MTEFSMHNIQSFYCDIYDKLTITERERFKSIIDNLTWNIYEQDMVKGFCGTYEIRLVDSTVFKGVKFRYDESLDYFFTDTEISHPQCRKVQGTTIVKWLIPQKIVKYIR